MLASSEVGVFAAQLDKKYHWSGPGYIVHYWKNGEEFWEPE